MALNVNLANTTANVIGNKPQELSEIEDFDAMAYNELLLAAAAPGLGELGEPNLNQKSKKGSVTGTETNEVCTRYIVPKVDD